MSVARQKFLQDLGALKEAIDLDPLSAGSTTPVDSRGLVILRRGMLITSLIALESFIRDRTSETLGVFSNWPATYQDLPQRLRDAALLDALPNLQKFARMMKRQEDDYEATIVEQVKLMGMTSGPAFGFSKFVAGDYTGNISDTSIKELLSNFQVKDCWNEFRTLAADVGFGVPSVHEIAKGLIGKRHKSAHSSDFVPTVDDIRTIPLNLTCLGLCFDAAITASAAYALYAWRNWRDGEFNWRDRVRIHFLDPAGSRFRLIRLGAARALRVSDNEAAAAAAMPPAAPGFVSLLVSRDAAERPLSWRIF